MAGVKGRSGGARVGAGRKAARPADIDASVAADAGERIDPRPTLELVAMGKLEVSPQQFKALTALLPYVHRKQGEGGKKEEVAAAAKKASNKFAASAPPLKLVSR